MPKVLIINHDEETMKLLKRWLEKRGLEARYVTEGEALAVMKEFKPEVVLVDVLQIEAAKKIKSDKELSDTPVVVMAGYALPQKEYITVANEVVHKPFDPAEIEIKIRKVLNTNVKK